MVATTAKLRKLVPRFSLLTIMLLMALVACAFTIRRLSQDLAKERANVRRLRNEFGVVHVEDARQVNAVRVRKFGELTEKWDLWIPKGHSFALRAMSGMIPHDGLPTGGATLLIDRAGELPVECQIVKDPTDGKWRLIVRTDTASFDGGVQDWLDMQHTAAKSESVGYKTIASDPEQPLVLVRRLFSASAPDESSLEDPALGWMIWLEPR